MQIVKVAVLIIFSILFSNLFSKTYKGAELRTNSTFLYGRFEVRLKSAAGSGMLSSFFTYHDTPNVPAQWNEIDIEILGKSSNSIQYNIITQGQIGHEVTKILQYNPHQAFHIYAIEWTPDYVAWSVDGFEIYRDTGNHISQLYYTPKLMMNIWPPDAVGWVGILNPGSLPLYAYYDWVKYYEYTPGTGDNFTLLWSDEFNAWNQARWSKATHTWYGNLCDFITQNAVFQDGYMRIADVMWPDGGLCWEINGPCGDANNDDIINILDVTHLISYLYKGGPEPDCGAESTGIIKE